MKTGMFIDPQGRDAQLVAGNETEFRLLVTRKLAAGWKRGPASPVVAPLTNETQVALGPVAPPAPAPALVEDRPVMAVSAEERAAAVAEARAGTSDGFGDPRAVEKAITEAVRATDKKPRK
jgi:hypothetical protein